MALEPQVDLTTDEQKVSYGFGLQFGGQLKRNEFEGMDVDAVCAAIRHSFLHGETAITDAELNPAFQRVQDKAKAAEAEKAGKYLALAEEFLKRNAEREGVSVTESGLQWEVLESGDGATPEATSTVVTHYHGTFPDGSVFDSSVERGDPAEFGVNQVIPAWTEALLMMSVGDKWRIACHPRLAYGEAGAGGSIPPNSALVFEIHLIDIK